MRFVLIITRILFIILSIFFGYLSFTRYQLHYVNGRYFDEKSSVVYNEDSVLVFTVFFIFSISFIIITSLLLKKQITKPQKV
jgi:hypothetical protein